VRLEAVLHSFVLYSQDHEKKKNINSNIFYLRMKNQIDTQ